MILRENNRMRIFLLTIFLAICSSSQAESTSFTELVEHTPSEVVTLNLDGRYALSIPGEYEYLIDKQDNQFFSSELVLFQKSYEETPDLAHILHVQFITLKEEGLKHWPTGAAYLELVKKGTASRRDTFETRKLSRIHVAER